MAGKFSIYKYVKLHGNGRTGTSTAEEKMRDRLFRAVQ